MDPDVLLFLGIVIGALAFPALVGSFSHGESPRTAILLGFVGGSLIVVAIAMTPGGYAFNEIPGIMVDVVRGTFN